MPTCRRKGDKSFELEPEVRMRGNDLGWSVVLAVRKGTELPMPDRLPY
jgi:hypothetical protein